MKVVLIPGPRDEAMIEELKKRINNMYDDEGDPSEVVDDELIAIDEMIDEYGPDEVFDALYYACENREKMLAEQARYFHDCLLYDERNYYIERMTGMEW